MSREGIKAGKERRRNERRYKEVQEWNIVKRDMEGKGSVERNMK